MGDPAARAGRPGPPDDDALLAAVAAMLDRVDPVPAGVVELARLSYGLRDLDSELARLVVDSSLDAGPVAVRAGATAAPRLLSFEAGDLELELEVTPPEPTGDGHRLLGMILPAGPARIEIHRVDGSSTVETDDEGRFSVHGLEPGPLRLTCHRPGGAAVSTPWTVLD